MSRSFALALAALTLFGLPAAVQAGSSQTLVGLNRTEPSLAFDPRNPHLVIIGTNTNYDVAQNGAYPNGFYRSTNGGRTFFAGSTPVTWPYTTQADPMIAIDRRGTIFYSYLAEEPEYCTSNTSRSGVFLTHSVDGGVSLRPPVMVDSSPADDKPALAVQWHRHRPSTIFLSWTRFDVNANTSSIWFSRSLDGGAHFSRPQFLGGSGGFNTGSQPVVFGAQRVAVLWNSFPDRPDSQGGPSRFLLRVSTNGGASFSPARTGASFAQIPMVLQPGSLRNLTEPAVTSQRGVLYVAWPRAANTGNGRVQDDIVVSRSVNGGRTWSVPVAINDSRSGDRFMPAITPLPGGDLAVGWYDRRRSTNLLDVYAARVSFRHGAMASPNIRVNAGPAPISDILYIPPSETCFIPGRFFGDYIGLAGIGRLVGVSWADTERGAAGQTDIWFRTVSLPSVSRRLR